MKNITYSINIFAPIKKVFEYTDDDEQKKIWMKYFNMTSRIFYLSGLEIECFRWMSFTNFLK